MKKQLFFAFALVASTTLFAQNDDSLDAVIQVENQYNPVVTKAPKQHFIPQTDETRNSNPLELEFSQKSNPFKGFTSERNIKELLPVQENALPGYARVGYGTGNNIDALVSYKYKINKQDEVKAMGGLKGYNTDIDGIAGKWDSRMYSSWINTEYIHKAEGATYNAYANFNNNVYNYYSLGDDNQNNKKYNIGVNTVSTIAGPWAYGLNVEYTRDEYRYFFGRKKSFAENNIVADGFLKYEFTDDTWRDVNVGLTLDNYSYDGVMPFKHYFSATLTPSVNLLYGDTKVRIGAHINMLSDNGGFLAIAPDLAFDTAINDYVALYATVKGGRRVNGFAELGEASPYWASAQPEPSYTIADVTAGTRISIEMVSIELLTGYAYTKDDLLTYTDVSFDSNNNPLAIYSGVAQENTKLFYAEANAGMDVNNRLRISAKARYNYWSCNHKYLLMMKPKTIVEANAEARLFEGLSLNVAYAFATYANKGLFGEAERKKELSARLNYKFMERFGAFIEGHNLLDNDYFRYAGYIEPGRSVLFGMSASF